MRASSQGEATGNSLQSALPAPHPLAAAGGGGRGRGPRLSLVVGFFARLRGFSPRGLTPARHTQGLKARIGRHQGPRRGHSFAQCIHHANPKRSSIGRDALVGVDPARGRRIVRRITHDTSSGRCVPTSPPHADLAMVNNPPSTQIKRQRHAPACLGPPSVDRRGSLGEINAATNFSNPLLIPPPIQSCTDDRSLLSPAVSQNNEGGGDLPPRGPQLRAGLHPRAPGGPAAVGGPVDALEVGSIGLGWGGLDCFNARRR